MCSSSAKHKTGWPAAAVLAGNLLDLQCVVLVPIRYDKTRVSCRSVHCQNNKDPQYSSPHVCVHMHTSVLLPCSFPRAGLQ